MVSMIFKDLKGCYTLQFWKRGKTMRHYITVYNLDDRLYIINYFDSQGNISYCDYPLTPIKVKY